MQFRDFLGVLRARWRTIAACALIVLGATAAYTLTLTPSYTATAPDLLLGDLPGHRGHPVAGRLRHHQSGPQHLHRGAALAGRHRPAARPSSACRAGAALNLSASVPPQASVLDITAVDGTAEGAARIANAVGPQLARVAAKFSPLLASAGQTVEATTITPAVAPDAPFSPNVKRNLALGLLAGIVTRDRCGLRPARPRHPGPLGGGPQGASRTGHSSRPSRWTGARRANPSPW